MRAILKRNHSRIVNTGFVILFASLLILTFVFEYDIQYLLNGFNRLAGKDLQVYFLDVGQANATLVVFPTGRTMLIDTGSAESEEEFLQATNKILKQNKISQIDMLLLTHSDEDHVGGAVAIFKNYMVKNFYRPKILSKSPLEVLDGRYKIVDSPYYSEVITAAYMEKNCDIEFVEDKILVEEDCVVEIFACKEDSYSDTNSYSPFITLSYKEKVFMLCGDATSKREAEFVAQLNSENRKISVDFLLVAHHGAKSSSTMEFLSSINPRYAIVSSGDNLHPTQIVVDRLIACGVEAIYCTKTEGMIGVAVESFERFLIETMEKRIDLPFLICIIFVVGASWNYYLFQNPHRRKFSRLSEIA